MTAFSLPACLFVSLFLCLRSATDVRIFLNRNWSTHARTNKDRRNGRGLTVERKLPAWCASGRPTWTGSWHHVGAVQNWRQSRVVYPCAETDERVHMSSSSTCVSNVIMRPPPAPIQRTTWRTDNQPIRRSVRFSSFSLSFFIRCQLTARLHNDAILFDRLPNPLLIYYRADNFSS